MLAIAVGNVGSDRVHQPPLDALGREAMASPMRACTPDGKVFAISRSGAEGAYQLVVSSAKGRSTMKVVRH
ncbi:MAG: hypothetical protein IPJ85_14155 [Flavobacteriales bacterium]|nr:hypothetical protein [Flavobacteriales bacterium]